MKPTVDLPDGDQWKTRDGISPDPGAAPPDQPQQIGRYRVKKILGEGGFGRVYLAHDDQLNRAVAIKVPRRQRVSRPEQAEAYLAEARVVASLDHPNIVPVHDIGTTPDGLCYVVSKVIDGSDLATKIRLGPLTHAQAAGLIATVAEALHYAHRKGLVHRDIKPGNILIDTGGVAHVADFGLALREQDFGKGATFAGTPAYMSPEQARGEGHRVDGRSDIFSLGVVFYELLVGRRPFKADSQDELLDQIANVEARPPRQCDDAIPKELERICSKALAKRASERYSTARDMADDLRHWSIVCGPSSVVQDKQPAAPQLAATGHGPGTTDTPAPTPTAPISDSRPIKIVPKGLRSFDAQDADFFLELLPGPRDRDGLPDSLRFWKSRIEEMDADNSFAVGLIYGPSGCGKSSLVKAGLLPRLSEDVIAVHVEATAGETEARLLNGLRKRCPAVSADLGLKEAMAALRVGQAALPVPAEPGQARLPVPRKKILIVLDQFEQWLHAKKEEQNTELVQALRQCDGSRVQCIVMVRDDFWMAATRFMRDLEIRLLEGQNSAAVDLFDLDHARKVLAAFGRAFGKLPENSGETSKEQKEFLNQAIGGLAEDGKVICVRLSLFAEMMKGKAWTPASLKAVGGTAGVGVTFLEETFSATSAPPEHRYHQNAARADLHALLPETGSDIKGHMRSYAELLEASGYGSRPRDFDDLIRILDNEVRLITPTDPEGKQGADTSTSQAQPGQKYYQLTHDYLVHSLREWLTRKQKETRRGRAELLLADRAGVWNARPENRQLPSLAQWLSIRWWTQARVWTPPQRKMMRKAGRYHALRGAALALLLAAATLAGLAILGQVVDKQNATRAAGLVQAVLNAETAQVPAIIEQMAEIRPWVDPLLRKEKEQAAARSRPELHASLALLPVDHEQAAYLYERLLDAAPHEVPVIRDALTSHKEKLLDRLWTVAETPNKGKESQRLRAAAALASYDRESPRWAKVQEAVGNDLVNVPAVYLAAWMDSLRPVREKLFAPLSDIYRNPGRRDVERSLATDILADYAADQPRLLAELLMDADEKQFAVIYPRALVHGDRTLGVLLGEIDRQAEVVPDRTVLEANGKIAGDDAKVPVSNGSSLTARRHEVPLQAGKKYRLTMDSSDLDSFLILQDSSGKEVAFDDDSGGNQNSLLVYPALAGGTYTVYAASFKGTGSYVLKVVETVDADAGKEKLAKRQANAAVALLRMGRPEKVWPLLRHSPDPRVRSYLIHRLGPLGADAAAIVHRLDAEPDVTIRRALILSLGEFGAKVTLAERKRWLPKFQGIYRTAADPGLHAASEWLLRHWEEEAWLKEVNAEWAKDLEQREKRLEEMTRVFTKEKEKAAPQWYVNGQGQTLVVVPGPVEFVMGSPLTEAERGDGELQHRKRIGRTFAIAAKAVTVEQFRKFDKAYALPAKHTRTAELPVVATGWYQAAAYCNWLSKQEDIPATEWCYEMNAKGQVAKLKVNYLSLAGYRHPTEAEMEYATRAGALTSRYFGETDELLAKYAWYTKNSREQTWPVGTLKPNDFGLFDVQGNVYTWCLESYKAYPKADGTEAGDYREESLVIYSTLGRVLRGGSFSNGALNVRSAYRNNILPATRNNIIGFRPARTFTP